MSERKDCGLCKSNNGVVYESELSSKEVWAFCKCGHITKYFPDGRKELWAGKVDSIFLSKIKDI